jgi:hypothetical protein
MKGNRYLLKFDTKRQKAKLFEMAGCRKLTVAYLLNRIVDGVISGRIDLDALIFKLNSTPPPPQKQDRHEAE